MKISFFLVVSKGGSVRTLKSYRSLNWDEIAIEQTLELPEALFSKPALSAHVKIPDSAAVSREISAEVAEDARLAIETVTGMEVRLTVATAESDTEPLL